MQHQLLFLHKQYFINYSLLFILSSFVFKNISKNNNEYREHPERQNGHNEIIVKILRIFLTRFFFVEYRNK